MSNLTVENLAGVIQGGNIEGLLGQNSIANTPLSDARVGQVMREQGMKVPSETGAVEGSGFSKALQDSIQRVNKDQVEADRAIKELVAGKTKNIHEVMLTLERADSSLKLMMAVRNKVLDAYKEIIRMQV